MAANRAIVLFDGDCPLCQRSVRILQKIDWLNALEFQNARETDKLPATKCELNPIRLLEEMHLVTPSRTRTYAGFAAFRWMAWQLPLLLPLAPLLYLPGVPWVGNKIYRWVARNRLNLVPCHDGACRVQLKKPAA